MDTALRARVMLGELEAMGLTLDDLLAAAGRSVPDRPRGPTVAEYLPTVAAAYVPRTRRTYNSYRIGASPWSWSGTSRWIG